MAAVGAEVPSSFFLSTGVVSFFLLLLLLSIFLTSLCSDCGRRSFELNNTSMEKNPSSLIKVVKLEDAMMARENPIINEIQNDEKEIPHNEEIPVQATAWRSHLVAPEISQEVQTEHQSPVQFPPWRSHLTGPQTKDVSGSSSPDSDQIYHTIEGGAPEAANHRLRSAAASEDLSAANMNPVYAQVSKKLSKTTPTAATPEQVEEGEEESSPPLPGRTTEMEE